MTSDVSPRFPLYVVSYGRYENCRTADVLDEMDVPYSLVVEAEEQDEYESRYGAENVLVVPERYHEEYEPCDEHGRSKPLGPGPARNFAWEHSEDAGYDWHWVMDDNIKHFHHYTDNLHVPLADGSGFRAMESFARQYENLAMCGPRYFMFVSRKNEIPPLTLNTRVYSCNLIRNGTGFRWRGRYNEDTDLSLRMLKRGWCTALFNVFLQQKTTTQTYDGGNTENFYAKEGTYPKSKMLKRLHPDVTKLTKKWGRWHHHVDYSGYDQPLRRDPDAPEPERLNLRLHEAT